MIKLMVSIYDKVAKEHGEIVILNNPGVAKRFFNSQMSKVHNPDDYELYAHGYYNTETGIITDLINESCFKPDVIDLGE